MLRHVKNSKTETPFGSLMPQRFQSAEKYRYTFQGQESDPEIKGEGNSINFKYRMHDPRLGRFFATDPLTKDYPWNSPYAFAENKVIQFIELEGLEAANPQYMAYEKGKTMIQKTVESTIDAVVFTVTNFMAGVGNTFKGMSKKVDRMGLFGALDDFNGVDVIPKDEQFSPRGFTFKDGLVKEDFNFSSDENVKFKDGIRMIKGTTTLVTAPLQLGVAGFVTKQGISKGLDQINKEEQKVNTLKPGEGVLKNTETKNIDVEGKKPVIPNLNSEVNETN